jgi:glycerophosphoryl diester phosphodiesterase
MSTKPAVLNIAHRGASLDAPQNSLEAFSLAIDQGADMIETDIHLSKDGVLLLAHDPEVGDSEIRHLTLEEIRGSLPGVVTLSEALDAFGDKIAFNLELKRGIDDDYSGLERQILDEVIGRGILEQTLFSSFYDALIERLHRLESSAHIGLLISRRAPVSIEERADNLEVEAIHLERAVVTQPLIERLQVEGYKVHVFTVDDPADQERLIDWGVDGIFTNVPAQLAKLLDQ